MQIVDPILSPYSEDCCKYSNSWGFVTVPLRKKTLKTPKPTGRAKGMSPSNPAEKGSFPNLFHTHPQREEGTLVAGHVF